MPQRKKIGLPSLADAIFLFFFAFFSFHGSLLLMDGDAGFHIRAGEEMIRIKGFFPTDIFSFYHPNLPWSKHSWLSELLMGSIHQKIGLSGIAVLYSFIIGAIVRTLYKSIHLACRSLLISVFVALLVVPNICLHWFARPHMFSTLLIVWWSYELALFQERDQKRILWLAPMSMAFWVNLHGGFVMGLILLGIYGAGNFLEAITSSVPEERDLFEDKAKKCLMMLLTSTLAACLNPEGFHALLYPFQMIHASYLSNHISEFLPPNFHDPLLLIYQGVLYGLIGYFILRPRRGLWIEVLIVIVFLHLALNAIRYLPYFLILIAPMAARALLEVRGWLGEGYVGLLRHAEGQLREIENHTIHWLWPILILTVVGIALVQNKIKTNFDENIFPEKAIQFIEKENLQGRVFNDDEFGDYMIYRLWPRWKVFSYGFNDFHGIQRLKDYLAVFKLEPRWEAVLKQHEIGWVFLRAKSPLSIVLQNHPGWKLVYADSLARIYVKQIPAYAALAKLEPV